MSGGLDPVRDHGGNLDRARAEFPDAGRPWIDLSTGINPHSYPLFDLPANVFARLPVDSRLAELTAAAGRCYGVASRGGIVAAPGTQILLPLVAALRPPGRARVLGPTYAEHARAAALVGHDTETVCDLAALEQADLAVIVNPNNPDGNLLRRDEILAMAYSLRKRNGLLVVDEAFMDVAPDGHSVAGDADAGNLVVLRSFGKFYGLAGIRLGFAISDEACARRLSATLGPWAVSAIAIEYGIRALDDLAWRRDMTRRLAREARDLDGLLSKAGIGIIGGTSLFRYARHADAARLSVHLASHSILARRFSHRDDALRFGLLADEGERRRLETALASWNDTKGRAP